MKNSYKIYFDNAATTPVDKGVLDAMLPYFSEKYGNASSLHQFGQESQQAVIKARQEIADILDCLSSEIIFTSGATESDNLATKGAVQSQNDKKLHIITTAIEHPAVLDTCKILEKQGVNVAYLPVSKEGIVSVADLEKEIHDETILVSVMYVNNEVGTIQPIVKIGEKLAKINQERSQQKLPKVIFHTDAVQAANYLDLNVKNLGVDLMSLSGHKIYGPKGIGLLYVKNRTAITRIQDGGHQEYGLRSGTLNTPGIVGMATALKTVDSRQSTVDRLKKLRDGLIDGVLKLVPDSQLNGSREKRLPNNANFSFRGVEGESLMIALDQAGIAVSTGSACASGSLEPSHVLMALGHSAEMAHSSLRISLGKYNTEKEVDYFLQVLPEIIQRLRKISGR